MYLIRLKFKNNEVTPHFLANINSCHQAVYSLMTDKSDRILWRKDRDNCLLVQMASFPNMKNYQEKYSNISESIDVKELSLTAEKLKDRKLFFKVRLNPWLKKDKRARTDEEIAGLITGANLLEYKISRERSPSFKHKDTEGKEINFLSCLVEGVLQVEDVEAFIKTLKQGIGGEKAFGFGMISIAPFVANYDSF